MAVLVEVEILTRRLEMKPRTNPLHCSHQEHREEDRAI